MRLKFSKVLNAALIDKFGGRRSAAAIAREFSLLPGCRRPISSETARKWLKGLGFPDLDNLVLLCNWLDLDLSMIFKKNHSSVVPGSVSSVVFGSRSTDRRAREALELLSALPDNRAEILIKLVKQLVEI